MSAVAPARQTSIPLSSEGVEFWKELKGEFQEKVSAINRSTITGEYGCALIIRETPEFAIVKQGTPSTEVVLRFDLEAWGPVIRVTTTGQRVDGQNFSVEQFDIPIARDLDGSVVGVFGEGKSLTVRDLARYVLQNFRRCFPNLALPC